MSPQAAHAAANKKPTGRTLRMRNIWTPFFLRIRWRPKDKGQRTEWVSLHNRAAGCKPCRPLLILDSCGMF